MTPLSPAFPRINRLRRRRRLRLQPFCRFPFLAVLAAAFLLLFAGTTLASDEAGEAYLAKVSTEVDVTTLKSGLRYKVLKKGYGIFHPTIDSPCLCHYAGAQIDGTEFDSSYGLGDPESFIPNQLIEGWTEALQLMVEGDTWELYVPSDLAYGREGSQPDIQPDSALVFKLELIEITGGKIDAITCDPATLGGCDDRMMAYVIKAQQKYGSDAGKIDDEIARMRKIKAKGGMTSDLMGWLDVRIYLLEKKVAPIHAKGEL